MVLPAVGFKAGHTDVRMIQNTNSILAFENREHSTIPNGVHQISQPFVYITYNTESKSEQVESGVVVDKLC